MIKTIDTANITDEMIEVAAGSAQLRAMAGVTEHDALIRGSILAALIVAPAVEPAQRCNCCGYLVTDSEHRGCLRAAKQEPAQAGQSGSCSNLMWATAEMREREHNRIGKMVGVLEQIKQEKLSALESAKAVPVKENNGFCAKGELCDCGGDVPRVREGCSNWRNSSKTTAQAVPVATVVVEPDYWSGGHFHKGSRPYITYSDIAKLPIGTKLCICPPPAIDETQQRALDFVRWIASLKTGGLIQARANDLLSMLEAGNE